MILSETRVGKKYFIKKFKIALDKKSCHVLFLF